MVYFSAIGTISAALQLDYFTKYAEFCAANSASKDHCMVKKSESYVAGFAIISVRYLIHPGIGL